MIINGFGLLFYYYCRVKHLTRCAHIGMRTENNVKGKITDVLLKLKMCHGPANGLSSTFIQTLIRNYNAILFIQSAFGDHSIQARIQRVF